ncbi:MAG: hypothetical protein ACYC7J_17530 [Syntrophales bacterium]
MTSLFSVTISSMAVASVAVAEQMHPGEKNEKQNKEPIFPNPVHEITCLSPEIHLRSIRSFALVVTS